MVYLFVGQDSLSKDALLKRLRNDFLPKELEQFNIDVFYARDLRLSLLQERILYIPLKSKKRIIVIREAQKLKEPLKEYLLKYIKKPHPQLLLVLDINQLDVKNRFTASLARYAKVYRFKEPLRLDTFSLARQIELGQPARAVRTLNQLLEKGQRPEFILGGLRYFLEKNTDGAQKLSSKLRLLLNCDLEIKTGRLAANFALEKLVIGLCGFTKPFH